LRQKPMRHSLFAASAALLLLYSYRPANAAPPWSYNADQKFQVELATDSPLGEASIREHAITWHPQKQKFYLVADVVPLGTSHHPNTYDTQLYLWSSPDLASWTLHGLAVPKGTSPRAYDAFGTASPAGMACIDSRLYVPFSARRTARFTGRSIGLAYSGVDPEQLPWTKLPMPISDLDGEDDDPAAVVEPGRDRLHVYHRTTGQGGYRIEHTWSDTPMVPGSWQAAVSVTSRPENVRAQELTGATYFGNQYHLFVIEHLTAAGMRIAHLVCARPAGPFLQLTPRRRYVERQPSGLAFGGHISPVVRHGRLEALFWTVHQKGKRYGLLGHPVR